MNDKPNIKVETLKPFTKFIYTLGQLPSSYLASMSYEEQLIWLCNYLSETVIPTVNNNGGAVSELQDLFIELQSYVNNYFDNLNVQTEINNKLDEMAEDGSLTNLISAYVDPIYQAYENDINEDLANYKSIIDDEVEDLESDVSTFKTTINTQVTTINNKVDAATSGSPLAASSTADMSDTTRIYVNTTDGNWYYYDGDSWEIGGVYQASDLTDADRLRLNSAYAESKNTKIKDLTNYYHYYYSSSSPYSQQNSDDYRTSDYIICEGYDKVAYQTTLSSAGFELLFYDKNKTLIPESCVAGRSAFAVKNVVSVPNTAYYVRITCWGSNYYNKAYIICYVDGGNAEITEANKNDIINLEEYVNNLQSLKFETYKPTIDGYVRYNDGVLVNDTSGTTDTRTDYILIKNYTKIKYKTSISSVGCAVAFFDANKLYLKSISIAGVGSLVENVINVPEGAVYVILSKYTSSAYTYITLFDDSYNYRTPILNKNILIFGDSITQTTNVTVNDDYETTAYSWINDTPHKWGWLLNQYFCPNEVRCYALNRASYAYKDLGIDDKRLYIYNQIRIAINDKNNPNNVFRLNSFTPDIVIFAAGTNKTATIGTYAEAMAKTVYEADGHTIDYDATLANLDLTVDIEAARYCYMKIKNEWPLAQIYVILPIQNMYREQGTYTMNVELEKLAKRYGAVIIDGADNGIVQEGNVYESSGVTLSDGLHPNQNGQYLMTRQILKSIEANYMPLEPFGYES